jgi:single-stranded-DNA-specific exonuclease
MGDALLALLLLIEDDPVRAHEQALELEALNNERRATEEELTREALAQAEQLYHGQRVLVLAGEGWHEGVKGIVASRIARRYGIPTVIFSIVGDEARGSGRSVGAVNLFKAVEACAGLTLRFGGHEGAAGVTVSKDKIGAFREALEEYMEGEPAEVFHPPVTVDAELRLREVGIEAIEELELLQPFGQENPQPLFACRNVFITGTRVVGAEKNHLGFSAQDGRSKVQAIWFQCPDVAGFSTYTGAVDIIFTLQVDEWNGRKTPKLMVKEIFKPDDTAECHPALDAGSSRVPAANGGDGGRTSGGTTVPLDTLRQTLIGDAPLHAAQLEALDALAAGHSTLAVMATGRGKSLIFYLHAARIAKEQGLASVFIYPLRALIADQAFHLARLFEPLGLTVATLTGETPFEQRELIYGRLAAKEIDVLLSTPEYLDFHAKTIAHSGRIGFVVVDEAHHIGQAKAGNRPAYARLKETIAEMGAPLVLAVTATANDEIAQNIKEALGVQCVVLDPTVRENLNVDDARNLADRELYVATIVAEEEKCIVYVNSRSEAMTLCRMLRRRVPTIASKIAFYHAGMTREDRLKVEALFRTGELLCIVSTSAFGEGVNIPDIRRVVLYHLPYNAIEFNQSAGRAGRDGQEACVHLLYADEDAATNAHILRANAPTRASLATLYKVLREQGGGRADDAALLSACKALDRGCELSERAVACGLAVFAELGLINVSGTGDAREITMRATEGKVELACSTRYLEGCDEYGLFEEFKGWAFAASPADLLARINQPILPQVV